MPRCTWAAGLKKGTLPVSQGDAEKQSVASGLKAEKRPLLRRGTGDFRRVNLGLAAAGFSTFALLYCVQPLMPSFASSFQISPSLASLALSATTTTLALALLVAGSISDRVGRKGLMGGCLMFVGGLSIASAFSSSWLSFLSLRTLEGLALSGVPAVAMAYLGEEVHPKDLGIAMGLYIGGTALGGMAGRVLTSFIVQASGSWRLAIGILGCAATASAVAFLLLLPKSHYFKPEPQTSLRLLAHRYCSNLIGNVQNGFLLKLFLIGFLIMGSLVTIYNYAGFYLQAPPFSLNEAASGAIFLVYLFGAPSSVIFGRLSNFCGRGAMLLLAVCLMLVGVILTLAGHLEIIIAGVALLTIGLFGGHAIASAWVSSAAPAARAQATSLYLFFYYTGSSLMGSAGGEFYSRGGWPFVVVLVCLALIFAVLIAALLIRDEGVRNRS